MRDDSVGSDIPRQVRTSNRELNVSKGFSGFDQGSENQELEEVKTRNQTTGRVYENER